MKNKIDGVEKGLSIIQEFYTEFFGTFIPGFIAVASMLLIGMGVIFLLLGQMPVASGLGDIKICFSLIIILFILCISYMTGAIIYRRAPKLPDAIASYRQWRESTTIKSRSRLSVEFKNDPLSFHNVGEYIASFMNRPEWIRAHAGLDIDYPYPHLRRYLFRRGLTHLANYVSWCDGPEMDSRRKESAERGGRTKHYVNVIKQRLRMIGPPGVVLDLLRNECHIRMLNSLWYVLKFLRTILVAGVILSIGCFVAWSVAGHNVSLTFENEYARTLYSAAGFTVLWALVWKLKVNIEKGFHYVRNREIVMILEGAYWMDFSTQNRQGSKGRKLIAPFNDIKKVGLQFGKRVCRKCKYKKHCFGNMPNDTKFDTKHK